MLRNVATLPWTWIFLGVGKLKAILKHAFLCNYDQNGVKSQLYLKTRPLFWSFSPEAGLGCVMASGGRGGLGWLRSCLPSSLRRSAGNKGDNNRGMMSLQTPVLSETMRKWADGHPKTRFNRSFRRLRRDCEVTPQFLARGCSEEK